LAGTTPQTGQLKDPFGRLGHGAGGLLLERFADQFAIGDHFTDRAIVVRAPQSVQASLAEGDHVTLDGSPTDPDDLSRLPASHLVV
jgi:hypothetical protein